MLSKAIAYVKIMIDKLNECIFWLIEDDDFLEKYHTIWDKISADIKNDFDYEPVYKKEILKTKIKSHGDTAKDFYDKKIPQVNSIPV